MASSMGFTHSSKYKISRRGKKLQETDDQRTLAALPKDVPERTWAEILQREETDLFIFELREDIVEEAMKIIYEKYMEKQNVLFTCHCAAQAWLQLIDWHFYRHDPGEEPSAYPPCYIPKRAESWVPDELPAPSPKDTWCRHELNAVECTTDEAPLKSTSTTSLDVPVIEEIPSEYWFPGKINVPEGMQRRKTRPPSDWEDDRGRRRPLVRQTMSGVWESVQESSSEPSSDADAALAADSEVLQKVTDYSEELSTKLSGYSALKTTTPVEGSLRGAGDSAVDRLRPKLRRHSDKSKSFSRPRYRSHHHQTTTPVEGSLRGAGDSAVDRLRPKLRRHSDKSKSFSRPSVAGRSRSLLPPLDPLDSRSRISIISDCRLRNLRLDTHYEVSPEKVDTPPGENVRRK